MTARPSLVILTLAAAGAAGLLFVEPHALTSAYPPATLGALVVLAATAWLLRELKPRDRAVVSAGAAGLGFLIGAVSGVGPFPAPLAYAGAFLPAALFFMAGLGRERLAYELARLEAEADDPAARPRVLRRAAALRDEARAAAREIDPEASASPRYPGDPRAVYAYAAQVVAYTQAQGGAFAEAIAALGEVPLPWMPAPMRPLMMGNLAFFHLSAGDGAGALAALDRLPESEAAAPHRAVLRAARAAALVHLDHPAEALALVGRSDADAVPPEHLRPRYAVVRAGALIALGEEGAARAALEPASGEEARRWRGAMPERIRRAMETLDQP